MAAKRKAKEIEDSKDAHANALLSRKAGQDTADAMEKLKQKEAAKAAADMKQQKLDDAKQRKAVLEQIQRDKEERQQRAAREKALREGKVEIGTCLMAFCFCRPGSQTRMPATPAAVPAPATVSTNVSSTGDFKDARLRIRHSGKTFETSLPSDRRRSSEYADLNLAMD